MARHVVYLLVLGGVFSGLSSVRAESSQQDPEKVSPALKFKMKSIQGKDVELAKYQGKVVMIVNVASQCGLTPQYEALQELDRKYAEEGLAVLGFPCNQFGRQEPGTEKEILQFCRTNYGVEFDMFAKVDVNGETQCELYKYLTSGKAGKEFAGPIKWNFEKFLVNRDGKVVKRFSPQVEPDSPEVIKAIERELAVKKTK